MSAAALVAGVGGLLLTPATGSAEGGANARSVALIANAAAAIGKKNGKRVSARDSSET